MLNFFVYSTCSYPIHYLLSFWIPPSPFLLLLLLQLLPCVFLLFLSFLLFVILILLSCIFPLISNVYFLSLSLSLFSSNDKLISSSNFSPHLPSLSPPVHRLFLFFMLLFILSPLLPFPISFFSASFSSF